MLTYGYVLLIIFMYNSKFKVNLYLRHPIRYYLTFNILASLCKMLFSLFSNFPN